MRTGVLTLDDPRLRPRAMRRSVSSRVRAPAALWPRSGADRWIHRGGLGGVSAFFVTPPLTRAPGQQPTEGSVNP